LKYGAIHESELVTRKQGSFSMASNNIQEWVRIHMPEKSSEELWYLSLCCLTELANRSDNKYKLDLEKIYSFLIHEEQV